MELLDICDEFGVPTGKTVERSVAHREGINHRTAHVWVVRVRDERVEVLLQKRALNKDSFPGRYDTSSAGHIKAGDEPLSSAIRELYEELSIKCAEEDLIEIGKFNVEYDKVFNGKMFKDRECAFVYIYKNEIDIESLKLQEEEIIDVKWFDIDTLEEALNNRDTTFCVPRGGFALVKEWAKKMMLCPCCKQRFIAEKYDICELCGWEYDPVQNKDKDLEGGANKLSLNQAIEHFKSIS